MGLLAKNQPKGKSPAEYEAEKAGYLAEAKAMTTEEIQLFMAKNKFAQQHIVRIMMYSMELKFRAPAPTVFSDEEVERMQR